MFAADLSWTDHATETVGERRERKARAQSTSSARSTKSSKSSLADRDNPWLPTLKKANAKAGPKAAVPAGRHASDSRKRSGSVPRPLDLDLPLKDPILHPPWTFSSSLSSTLPSGAPLDPPECEVPELEGDVSSRRTNSGDSNCSKEVHFGWKLPGKLGVLESPESGAFSAGPLVARSKDSINLDAHDVGTPELEACHISGSAQGKKAMMGLEHLTLGAARESAPCTAEMPRSRGLSALASWKSPRDGDVGQATKRKPEPARGEPALAYSSTLEFSRFPRFIRKIEDAGPEMILNHLKGGPEDTAREMDEGSKLERQLWVLTAMSTFQLQHLGRSPTHPRPPPPGTPGKGKSLELYGNLAEVYQLSAMHPTRKIHYVSTTPQQPTPLPANVSYLTVPQVGAVPLPYPASSFSHIRTSTLPSLVPSSRLPQMFHECHRLLEPGGTLEIRMMDAAPLRHTAGPKMRGWIEDRLALNLERLFRCSKPCMVVPTWVVDAGFDVPSRGAGAASQGLTIPCASHEQTSTVDERLSARVARALWKDIWGGYVDDAPGEARWWWEDSDVMSECLERGTVFECRALVAVKRS